MLHARISNKADRPGLCTAQSLANRFLQEYASQQLAADAVDSVTCLNGSCEASIRGVARHEWLFTTFSWLSVHAEPEIC